MNVKRNRVSTLLLLVLLVWSGPLAVQAQEAEGEEPERKTKTVKMYADNWSWSPDLIRVKQGTRVVIRFENRDAPHSFVLKGYGIKVPLRQDAKAETEFVADKVGTFKWRCGRPCGNGCPKMTGKLVVME
jgi:heme/copper-type cytochrome/quinol oxidase subunit 2